MKDDLLRSIQQGFLKFAAERIHRARLAAAAALAIYPRLICSPGLLAHLKDFPRPYSTPIMTDHLGRNVANLFTIPFEPRGKMPAVEFARSVWGLGTIESVVASELRKYSDVPQKDEKIAEKWHYMNTVIPLMLAALKERC